MLGFNVGWDAQADRFVYWLSFATEFALLLTWMSLVAAEERSGRRVRGAACLSVSEFGAPRLTRAPQGIRPSGPDGGRGDSVFAYFFR